MDRTEWLACGSPQAMLEFLQGPMSPNMRRMDAPWEHPVSDRKLRLFFEAAGCDLCHVSGMSPAAERAVYVAGASCGTQAGKAALLREIVGDPFHPWMREDAFIAGQPTPEKSISVVWSTWLTPTVLSLAQAAYSGDWAVLPVLWDALEEAGCTEASIRKHLLSPGPHVKGCWVVDLLLGKS